MLYNKIGLDWITKTEDLYTSIQFSQALQADLLMITNGRTNQPNNQTTNLQLIYVD